MAYLTFNNLWGHTSSNEKVVYNECARKNIAKISWGRTGFFLWDVERTFFNKGDICGGVIYCLLIFIFGILKKFKYNKKIIKFQNILSLQEIKNTYFCLFCICISNL